MPAAAVCQAVWEWVEQFADEKGFVIPWSGFDTWGAELLMKRWQEHYGKNAVEAVIQGAKTQSNPMKELKADLQAKLINYNNNPIFKWCFERFFDVFQSNFTFTQTNQRTHEKAHHLL